MTLCCNKCQTQMKLQESIDGGGDSIERYTCPKCGKESYLGKFTFRPLLRQVDADASRQKLFHCARCNIRTAGVVLNVKSECRWCPICHTPLFQYSECERERLEREGTLCPTCHAFNLVKEAKPHIDERTAQERRGGAWNA